MRKILLCILISINYYSYAQNNYSYSTEYFSKEYQITYYPDEKNIEVGSTVTIDYSNFPPQNSSWFWFVILPYKEKYNSSDYLAGGSRLGYSDYIYSNGKWTTKMNHKGKLRIKLIDGISGLTLKSFNFLILNVTDKKLGIDEIQEKTVPVIFPNPTNGIFKIETQETLSEIQIHDQVGRCILKTASNSVDISAQPSGIYFATIQNSNDGIWKRKIIKK